MARVADPEADHRFDELPVADRPLIRELSSWATFLPFGGRVIALQGAHPTVAKGLYDHSTSITNPLDRGRLTTEYAMRMMFGDDRAGTAAEIRELHRDIKGVGFDGKPYHAWNRDAWTWVHLTTCEALLYGVRAIYGEPPMDQQEAFYESFKASGELYGVRAQDMPDDVAGLHAYIRDGVETKLTHVPDLSLFQRQPRIPGVPEPVWRRLMGAASGPVQVLFAGSFPSTIRERWGVRWSPVHEAAYRSRLLALRAVSAPLPDRLRMMPYAYRALHPQAA